jgi:dCTP deaminase
MNNNLNYDSAVMLSRAEIIERLIEKTEKRIIINPILSSKQMQPASVDVRLGTDFLVIKIGKLTHMDSLQDPMDTQYEVEKYTDKYKILKKFDKFVLHPNEFILASTLEYIRLPLDIAARLEGRSSWARFGIAVHATAGFVDPGYGGNLTFELKNNGKVPVDIYPGARMGQLAFFKINNTDKENKYRGKYNESFGVVASKYFQDPEFKRMRKMYHNYDKIIKDIFDAVDKDTGVPYSNKLPQSLIDSIEKIYRERK